MKRRGREQCHYCMRERFVGRRESRYIIEVKGAEELSSSPGTFVVELP